MTFLQRRPLIPLPVVLIGILLGRLAVRAVLNLLPGAPCLGGTFCERNEKGRKEGSAHVGLIHTGVFLAAFIASAAVRMTFGAVGPSCFCPEDRGCFGLDQSGEAAALGEHNAPREYIVFPHSGHGLQNDSRLYALYMDKVEDYSDKYMGV